MKVFDRIMAKLNPSTNPDLTTVSTRWPEQLPILWLLGKTGAGKSSIIQAVTGNTDIEIGQGFRPCTPHSFHYDFPSHQPVLRFLDTRGLAEAQYNADEDIQQCQSQSHALLVVMKAEDPEQQCVLQALKHIRQSGVIQQLLLVQTGVDQLPNDLERARCLDHHREQVTQVWGEGFSAVSVNVGTEGQVSGITDFTAQLCQLLPILNQILLQAQYSSQEVRNFEQLKREILWYSATAGASDAMPVLGLVSVPTIQAKMLHSLANQYGVDWNKRILTEFIGTLGTGFGVQYFGRLGIRQLVKWVPVYGQTVGAASAATLSFGSTYAMGRVACKYLFHKSKGERVSEKEMTELYKATFDHIKAVAVRETNTQ